MDAINRAKRYCENDLDPMSWASFPSTGGSFLVIYIKDKDEADLFRLLFMGEKGIHGLITLS